ncbi:LysR family transcriptional regulator [Olsenella uli]|uniref:LysR family transcriptional regulator n=1 Tax=Olsenella uli TaxID=133926 RepID=UPI00242CAA95|nr:LysR family transcriptional regulator [Olsenella uli]
MNFQSMDYFIAVAEERSFTHAARRLSVTQQTLSAHIAGVERELGVRLVNRRVPLTLTYAGHEFLSYARRFQAEHRAMRQEFRDISGDERGLLGVGVASTRGRMIMPRALSAFQEAHPGVNVLLHEEENAVLIELLREGRVDVIVASVPEDEPGFVVRELYHERVVLLATDDLLRRACDDPAAAVAEVERTGSLAPLSACPFMLLGQGDEPGDLSRRILAASGVSPWERVRSRNSETLVDLAARGVGACFVPYDLASSVLDVGGGGARGLRAIGLGPEAQISISVAWRAAPHVWSVIESFCELLDEQLSDDAVRLAHRGRT